jgi:hypothetical protein
MHPDSRQTIHMGINFIVSPIPTIDKTSKRKFDESLETQGIDFSEIKLSEREIIVIRETPSRLEIKIAAVGPPAIGQLLIVAPNPSSPDSFTDLFAKEAQAVVKAFEAAWPAQNRQVIHRDVTFRDLYETSAQHAFAELWETVLGQSSEKLSKLGRPVLGGGLRFVMPPIATEAEPVQVEVKIESYLRDTKKIFIETQFTWPQPMMPGIPMDPEDRLRRVDEYIESKVFAFITGDSL